MWPIIIFSLWDYKTNWKMNLLRHQEHFIVDLRFFFYLTAWASFLRNSSFQAGLLTAVSEKLSVLTLLYSARQRLKFKNDYLFFFPPSVSVKWSRCPLLSQYWTATSPSNWPAYIKANQKPNWCGSQSESHPDNPSLLPPLLWRHLRYRVYLFRDQV